MNEHRININYRNEGGLRELETSYLIATISTIKFKKECSFGENGQKFSSLIHMHAIVSHPEKHKGNLIEITICPSEATSAIFVAEKEEKGVGVLNGHMLGGSIEFLGLDAVPESSYFQEIEQLLARSYFNGVQPIIFESSVLGIGPACEWDVEKGPLLVKKISITVGEHAT